MNEQAKAQFNALLNKWELEADAKLQVLTKTVGIKSVAQLEGEIEAMRTLSKELKAVVDIQDEVTTL